MNENYEIVNTTYYNTDDIRAIIDAVSASRGGYRSNRLTKVRVKYLGKTQPFDPDGGQGYSRHHWSAASRGWGEILQEGDHPRASASYEKGGSRYYTDTFVLSLARRNKIGGDSGVEALTTASGAVPSVGVKHVAFALWTFFSKGGDGFNRFWGSGKCPTQLRIEKGSDKEARLTDAVAMAKKRVEKAGEMVDQYAWHLEYHQSAVDTAKGNLKAAKEMVQKREAEVAAAEDALASFRADAIIKKVGSASPDEGDASE